MLENGCHPRFKERIMMIQANYGVSAYGGIAALSAQRQASRITQAMTAAAAETAEQVTISDAGKALAA